MTPGSFSSTFRRLYRSNISWLRWCRRLWVNEPRRSVWRTSRSRAARHAGFVQVKGAWFGEDRLGVEHPEEVAVDADPARPANVNCRPATAPVWRDALLYRDWLRSQPDERASYEAMKARLADGDHVHVDRYSEDKMPWIRAGLERAERWATATGWMP